MSRAKKEAPGTFDRCRGLIQEYKDARYYTMMKEKSQARRDHRLKVTPADESDVFYSMEEIAPWYEENRKRILPAVHDRVSHKGQKENLETRKPWLLKKCKEYGISQKALAWLPGGKIAYFGEIAKGETDYLDFRKVLKLAIETAIEKAVKTNKRYVLFIMLAVYRLIRTAGEYNAQPGEWDITLWRRFLCHELAEIPGAENVEVRFAFITPPGTPYEEVHADLSKLGKKKPDGRPSKKSHGYKKALREKYFPIVCELYDKNLSSREIEAIILNKVTYRTICRWVQKEES